MAYPIFVEFIWAALPDIGKALLALAPAIATILAALFAFGAAERQIEKQSTAALDRWRLAEKQKYKAEFYERIVKFDAAVTDSSSKVIGSLKSQVSYLNGVLSSGVDQNRFHSNLTIEKLHDYLFSSTRSINELILEIERWEIVDPRLSVFRLAFRISVDEMHAHNAALLKIAPRVLPFEPDDRLPEGYWEPLSSESIRAFEVAVEQVCAIHDRLMAWMMDLGIEMQMLTLREIFDQTLSKREPPDRSQIVISLDNHIEVERRLRTETARGREITEIGEAARKHFSHSSGI